MATNKKFNVKKTVLEKFRDLIETTGCQDMEEFIATPAYKMYLDNPHPQMNSVERDYVDVIVRGIFTNKSNQDIIDEIRLLWRASGTDEHQLSIDQNITIDMNIDGDDGTPEPPTDTLILETGKVMSDSDITPSDERDNGDIISDVSTQTEYDVSADTIVPNINRDDIIDAVMLSRSTPPAPRNGSAPANSPTFNTSSTVPILTSCKNINEMREAVLASGYKGRVDNPLYGKPFVPIYSDDEIARATPGRRISMRMENAMAKTNQNMPYIIVS